MSKGYDNLIDLNFGSLMDLSFQKGAGAAGTYLEDVAKPHHQGAMLVGPPTWGHAAPGNKNILTFSGAGHYLECPAANTVDLNFTTGDYTLAVWINWLTNAGTQIVMGRYELDVSGWEFYLTEGAFNFLTLRHNHASGGADTRDACFSTGWDFATWWLCAVTVTKAGGTSYPQHYRNGVAVETTWDAGGVKDADTCPQDLVVGCRYSKNTNFFVGNMYRPRIWNRALSAYEIKLLFTMERSFFSV